MVMYICIQNSKVIECFVACTFNANVCVTYNAFLIKLLNCVFFLFSVCEIINEIHVWQTRSVYMYTRIADL